MGNVHMEATQINYRGGASKMNVEEAIKSAIELTPEQKTNINKIPTIEAAVGNKTDQDVIASEFDAEAGVYAVGDLVMHEGKLYEFTSAHETAGDWNAEEVSEKTVSDELDTLKSGLSKISILKVYQKWASSITVPGGMNTIVMFAKVSGQSNMFTYNFYSDVLTPIGNSSGVTATKDASTDTVTFSADASGSFSIYVF